MLLPTQMFRQLRNRLKKLGYKSYSAYLVSAHWISTVAKFRKQNCEYCGFNKDLHLHHFTYQNLGNETKDDFLTLCGKCHEYEHQVLLQNDKVLMPSSLCGNAIAEEKMIYDPSFNPSLVIHQHNEKVAQTYSPMKTKLKKKKDNKYKKFHKKKK
jgi:hypothetical protein